MNLTIDLIIRIKNGYLSGRKKIIGLYSKINESCLQLLKQYGYIQDYKLIVENNKKQFEIILKYDGYQPALTNVKIISKPGRRIYLPIKKIKPVLGGLGLSIISSPKGIITNKQAYKLKVGGQVLFEIW